MKKKFFAMYALVGALVASPVFTSCIDDTESESVSAIRNAKAEAIKVATALKQAEADRKAQLEELKLAMDMANYEQQKAMYEKYLLDYQLQIEKAKKDLKDYQETTLSELTDAYTKALSYVATSEWEVVKYNQQIAQLKENFVGQQEFVKEETARLEAEIAKQEAKIANAKKVQEAGLDKTSMDESLKELQIAAEQASKEFVELENKYGEDAAKTVTGKAITLLDELATASVKYYQSNVEGNPVLVESAVAAQQKAYAEDLADEELALAQAIAKLGKEDDKIDTQYEKKESVDAEAVKTSTEYANLAISNEYLKTLEKVLADAEKALAELPADATEQAKSEAEGKVEEAEENIEKFKNDDEGSKVYTFEIGEGEAAKEYKAKGLAYAEMNILKAKDDIVTAEVTLAEAKEDSEAFEAAIAAFAGEDYEAYLAAVAELDAAEKASQNATAEYDALKEVYDDIDGKQFHINKATWNGNGYSWTWTAVSPAEYIEDCERYIADYKAEIAELEAVVDYDNVEADSEEALAVLIAYIEKQIAIEEANLVLYNKMVEEAKAALDAYLAE